MARRKPAPAAPVAYTNLAPFRAVERRYKKHAVPKAQLDLSHVLDLECTQDVEWTVANCAPDVWAPPSDAPEHGPPPVLELAMPPTPEGHLHDQLRRALGLSAPPRDAPPIKLLTLPHCPGLVILPAAVPEDVQRHFAARALQSYANPPAPSNVATHWDLPRNGLWAHVGDAEPVALRRPDVDVQLRPEPARELLAKRIRWATLGAKYDWTTKAYVGLPRDAQGAVLVPERARDSGASGSDSDADGRDAVLAVPTPIPRDLAALATALAAYAAPATHYREPLAPQAAVVNYYGLGDSLMGHVDESEPNAAAPLVSVSLGCACVFVVGGATRDTRPVAVKLRSGDAVLMAGQARRAFHGVPRVLENEWPAWMRGEGVVEEVMRARPGGMRINLNLRQVF